MGTVAAIGLSKGDSHWDGTLVRYDGYPEALGPRLLDLAVDHQGDLDALWRALSRHPQGWKSAFTAAYDGEWGIARVGPPLVRDDDFIITRQGTDGSVDLTGPEYWYLLDPRERTLTIWEPPSAFAPGTPPSLLFSARFDARGIATFDDAPTAVLDWRNRRKHYGDEDPQLTATALTKMLDTRAYVAASHFSFGRSRVVITDESGIVCPLVANSSLGRPLPDGIEDVCEHDSFLMFPRRVLGDHARCTGALDAALSAIHDESGRGRGVAFETAEWLYSNLFPFDLLDLELSMPALLRAIDERVRGVFADPRR